VILFFIFLYLHLIHFFWKSRFVNSHFEHIHTIFFLPYKKQRVKISSINKVLNFIDLKPISTILFFYYKYISSTILIFGGFSNWS
jgi:hypothetical protein